MNKFVLSAAVLVALHVCGSLRTLTFAQGKPAPPSGAIVRSANSASDQPGMMILARKMDSTKKQVIADNLTLTDDEAIKFWPLYDQYSAELKQITDDKNALMNEYAEKYGSLTEEQADRLIRRWLDSDIAVFELRRKYLPMFRKVLPGRVTATFFQVEHRISAIIDLQFTSQLPLMQSRRDSAELQ